MIDMDLPGRMIVPALVAVTVVAMMPNSLIVPGLPVIAAGLGIARPAIGMLITAYTVSSGIAALFAGMAADRAGRKVVLIPALLLFAFGGLMPFLTSEFALILAGRAVQGVGGAGLMSAVYGLAGDILPDVRARNRVLGFITGTIGVSEVAVPIVGGALAQLGWKAPFAGYALAVPTAVLCGCVLPKSRRSDRCAGDYVDYVRGLGPTLGSRPIVTALIAKFVATGAYFVLLTSAPFMVSARVGGSSLATGLLMVPMGLAWAGCALSLGRLAARWGLRGLTVVGFVILAVASCAMAVSWSYVSIGFAFAVWGVGSGLVHPSVLATVIEHAGDTYRGAASSLHGCMSLLGGSLGPVAAGLLATSSGDPAPAFYLASPVLVGAAIGYALLTCRTTRGAPPEALPAPED